MHKHLLVTIPFLLAFETSGLCQMQTYEWVSAMPGNSLVYQTQLATDGQGNSYSVGSFFGTMDADPGPGVLTLSSSGQYDGFIIKLDVNGQLDWAYSFGSIYNDYCVGVSALANGTIALAGVFEGTIDCPGTGVQSITSGLAGNSFIQWLDPSGTSIDVQQIGGNSAGNNCVVQAIASDGSSNLYVGGMFYQKVDLDPGPAVHYDSTYGGNFDIFVVSVDASRNFRWASTPGDSSVDETLTNLCVDLAGNVTAAMSFETRTKIGNTYYYSYGYNDLMVIRLSSGGNVQWGSRIGGAGSNYCRAMVGLIGGDVLLSMACYDEYDVDPGPGVVNLGDSMQSSTALVKLNAGGHYAWSVRMTGDPDFTGLSVNSSDGVYLCGTYIDSTDFDPGVGTAWEYCATPLCYVSRIDTTGVFDWVQTFGDSAAVCAIAWNAMDNLFVNGFFSGVCDFAPGVAVDNDTTLAQGYSLFVSRFSSPNGVENADASEAISIFPNPSADQCMIRLTHAQLVTAICLTDVSGKEVLVQPVNNRVDNVVLNYQLPNGIYMLSVYNQEGLYQTCKLVISH